MTGAVCQVCYGIVPLCRRCEGLPEEWEPQDEDCGRCLWHYKDCVCRVERVLGPAKMTHLANKELRAAEIAAGVHGRMTVDERTGWYAHRADRYALSMKRPGQETGWLARQILMTEG